MRRIIIRTFLFLVMAAILSSCGGKIKMVSGTYSADGTNGINILEFDKTTGALKLLSSFNAGANPSYLCLSEKKNLIYVINEVDSFTYSRSGGLTTVSHDGSFGSLKKEAAMAIPNGGPCHISQSPSGDFMLIANYGGGSVAVVRLDEKGLPATVTDTVFFKGDSGSVSHAHMAMFDPGGMKVYVSDLGLDRIWIFLLNNYTGKLMAANPGDISLPKGTGPRHFTFNSDGTILYVIGELNSTMNVFKTDSEKGLIPLQVLSTLKEGTVNENACADIHIAQSGKYLYGSNRGDNSIVTYSVKEDGTLSFVGVNDCGGNWPRNFSIDPAGRFMLVGNQKSDNIAVLKIDQKTGLPSVKVNEINLHAPVCLKF